MPSSLSEAAAALGISRRELKRWIAAGAPVIVRGRRGRGNRELLDVEALRAWDAARRAPRDAVRAAMATLAHQLPERLATEVAELFETPLNHRGALWQLLGLPAIPAARLHLAAYVVALDAVRGLIGETIGAEALPPLTRHPDVIERLEKLAQL